ncbi:HET-domain-containing protein [Cadophora sp. DSE1049]|nr:HET-domain-containing protein [Cadophora sp. DSE1049]
MVTDASTLPSVLPNCPICHNLAESALEDRIEFSIHNNEDFAKSAATKCLACRTIRDGVLSFVRSTKHFPHVTLRLRGKGEYQNQQGNRAFEPELVVQVLRTNWDWKPEDVRPLWNSSDGGSLNLQFFSPPGGRSPWKVIPEYPEPSLDSSSNLAMAKVRDWLDTCTTKHQNCVQTDTEMPTRALFVGDDKHPPHLVSTEGRRGKYTALTWCWGTEPALTTTEISLHDHEREIPWSHLPYLFKDAALVTRKLGIDYIWIDALCIIQDSDDDWINEASKMTQVYGDAYLTIAADTCHNAFHSLSGTGPFRNLFIPKSEVKLGLRGDGHLRNLLRSKFSMPCSNSAGIANVKVRLDPDHDSSGCHGGKFAVPSSLKTRGWCLKEHILSRRLLHFGAVEMSW